MRLKSLKSPLAAILILSMITPFTQPASAKGGTGSALTSRISQLGSQTGEFIFGSIANDNAKREAFTKQMISELTKRYPGYNFVISHHKKSKAEGPEVVHDHVELKLTRGSAGYEIFASRKGKPFKFSLNGDGGYRNWAYGGDFNRNGTTLIAK